MSRIDDIERGLYSVYENTSEPVQSEHECGENPELGCIHERCNCGRRRNIGEPSQDYPEAPQKIVSDWESMGVKK